MTVIYKDFFVRRYFIFIYVSYSVFPFTSFSSQITIKWHILWSLDSENKSLLATPPAGPNLKKSPQVVRAWKKAPSTQAAFKTNEGVKHFPAFWTDDIVGYSVLLKKKLFFEATSLSPWRSWEKFQPDSLAPLQASVPQHSSAPQMAALAGSWEHPHLRCPWVGASTTVKRPGNAEASLPPYATDQLCAYVTPKTKGSAKVTPESVAELVLQPWSSNSQFGAFWHRMLIPPCVVDYVGFWENGLSELRNMFIFKNAKLGEIKLDVGWYFVCIKIKT